jgi:hypothetical protein
MGLRMGGEGRGFRFDDKKLCTHNINMNIVTQAFFFQNGETPRSLHQ